MPYLSEDGEALSGLLAQQRDGICFGKSAASEESVPVWLAGYTTPRHEKSVARHFQARDVECFLPLCVEERRWKNGCKVYVEFPVFRSYLFVRTCQQNASRLLEIPGMVAWVGPGRGGMPIPNEEIDLLQRELPLRKFEPHPYLTVGCKVRIASGPLSGACGVLIRKKSGYRVVLAIDLIRQSVAVEVAANEIQPV